jgi:hypothetical protein
MDIYKRVKPFHLHEPPVWYGKEYVTYLKIYKSGVQITL